MQVNVGRPKDLEKKQSILDAAKHLFLMHGYHGSSMNQIAKAAGVTKLTIYNHFQDKATLFTYAVENTCESIIQAMPIVLNGQSDFRTSLYEACALSMNIVNLPEAIKLDLLLMELASQQSPLAEQFYNASHVKLDAMWNQFFQNAQQHHFIQSADPQRQTELIASLLFGTRHQKILLGLIVPPTPQEQQQIIESAIEIFLLKYANRT